MKTAEALFDALAHEYEEVRREVGWDPFPHVQHALSLHPLPEHAEILDVGGGTGEVASWLMKRGHDLTLFDASSEMCDAARARVEKLLPPPPSPGLARLTPPRTIQGRFVAIHGDMNRGLPFPPDHFDALLALGCMEYAEDLESLLRDFLRVLKPGGRLLTVVELCGPGLPGGEAALVPFLDDWTRRRWPLARLQSFAAGALSPLELVEVPGFHLEDDGVFSRYGRVLGLKR